MKLKNYKSAIILPLKETYSNFDFGAVSIWVKDYLTNNKNLNDLVFCRKLTNKNNYLTKNVKPILVSEKFFTNSNYIKKIYNEIVKLDIDIIEIHNRPEYALYILKNNPDIKINLIFHNDPNTLRSSNTKALKLKLLEKCNKVIFVSKWLKNRFFYDLQINHKNNIEIIYNFVNKIRKFPKKEKKIIFSGKLNKSKGFDIFGKAIIKILDKFPDWSALVYGNEQRETFSFKHKRLKINNWINHKKLLKVYEKTSISVVNPTWQEPFGRTALESASRGCAVITSLSGGLSETFNNNLILKKNNTNELIKMISKLIEDKNFLLKKQKENFNNIIHTPSKSVNKLNSLRKNDFKNKNKAKSFFKILHISNFGIKTDHRLFNLSIANKLSNGLIRNGHDVINFDYRDFASRFFNSDSVDKKILSISGNYKPDLILLGHNNNLHRETLMFLKKNLNCKIALWYEDHVVKGDPNYINNIKLIEKNNDLIDNYFITTSPDIIKTIIKKDKIDFLPIPVDPNIESGKFYEFAKTKDLFFALSHGVNYGRLKKNTNDNRLKFIKDLLTNSTDSLNFNFLGLFGEQPKWNYDFNKELMISKTALNLSRGGPNKYASSNRIATLMGNGVLPFIHENVKYQDFFDNDEIITYKNSFDLISKLSSVKDEKNKIIKRSKNAKKRYYDIFNNTIVADFLVYKIFNNKKKFKYIWKY
jgi:glycosyltransferase involved in cell wall biosynthesis